MTSAAKVKNIDELYDYIPDTEEAEDIIGKIKDVTSKSARLNDMSERLDRAKNEVEKRAMMKDEDEWMTEWPNWDIADAETQTSPPDPEEIEKSEARAIVEVKSALPAMIESTITDVATDNVAVGMQKLVDAQNVIDSLPPGDEKDALNDDIVKTMMSFTAKVTDPLTGETKEKPLFDSEADARKFINDFKNQKHLKRLRWHRPVLWKRLHGEQRGNLSPMTYRTLKSKSPF